uniref:Uncharacterized protein n=1 Tax=viral metagenome TaxID=1070528 RepID=A0A6H1ZHS0_9ZZZZ
MENQEEEVFDPVKVREQYWLDLAFTYQNALTRLGNEDSTPPAALVSAAKEVFDRAYGKVADKVELSGEVKLNLNLEN